MGKRNRLRAVRRYSDEFKTKAVHLALHPDLRGKNVAEALDIHPFMLSKWKKDYREGRIVDTQGKKPKIDMASKDQASRLEVLERRVQELEVENDLLKKTIQFNLEKRRTSSNS